MSISNTLYDWLHHSRLVAPVARRMNKKESTLSAELRPANTQAKLGADELVPLFQAIRDVGYGDQLRGVLTRFIRELEGQEPIPRSREDFSSQLHELYGCLGELSKAAAQLETISTAEDLRRLKTALRTDVITRVCQLEDIVDSRLARLHRQERALMHPVRGRLSSLTATEPESRAESHR